MKTFEQYCSENNVELRDWQKEAANAFLEKMYPHREGPAGKTFLMNKLNGFFAEYGNCFKLNEEVLV